MTLSRDFTADLEIRSDGAGRTVHGIVVPFGVSARVNDGTGPYLESFQKGAFARTLANRRGAV
jgi:phage head maturation protease